MKKDTDEQVKEDKKVETNKNNTDENFKLIFSTFDGKDHHEKAIEERIAHGHPFI